MTGSYLHLVELVDRDDDHPLRPADTDGEHPLDVGGPAGTRDHGDVLGGGRVELRPQGCGVREDAIGLDDGHVDRRQGGRHALLDVRAVLNQGTRLGDGPVHLADPDLRLVTALARELEVEPRHGRRERPAIDAVQERAVGPHCVGPWLVRDAFLSQRPHDEVEGFGLGREPMDLGADRLRASSEVLVVHRSPPGEVFAGPFPPRSRRSVRGHREHVSAGRATDGERALRSIPGHSTRYRATASSFHSTPEPGRSSSTAQPSTTRSGCSMMGLNHSAYSSQWAVGVAHRRWVLTSMKRWFESRMEWASPSAAARSQPVTPPIFMTSGIM